MASVQDSQRPPCHKEESKKLININSNFLVVILRLHPFPVDYNAIIGTLKIKRNKLRNNK